MTDAIFSGTTITIPLADVQHIEREVWGGKELIGLTVVDGPERIRYTVVTKHSVRGADGKWLNAIILPHYEGAQFMKAWGQYRSELEGNQEPVSCIQPEFEELKTAVQPVLDFLYKYGDPHTSLIIEMGFVKIVQDKMGVPLEIRD